MVVSASHAADILRPRLNYLVGQTPWLTQWSVHFGPAIVASHIWVPKLSLPVAVAAGVAATVIKNPSITRRFWARWSW